MSLTMPNLTSVTSIYIDRAFVIAGSFWNGMLFFMILRNLYQKRKEVKFTNRMIIMNVTALLVAFCNTLFCVSNSFIEFAIYPFSACRVLDAATASMWVVAKLFLYLFFLLRIDVVFRDSNYGLSSPNLTFWYVLIVIAIALDLTIVAMFWDVAIITVGGIKFCSPNAPLFVYAHAIGWDFILSFCLIAVFVSKIRYADMKVQGSMDMQTKNKGLDRLLKFSFLGGIAIASTLILISFVSLTQWNFPGSLDSMINTLMIYLTYDKQHRRILRFLKKACYCFIVCLCRSYLDHQYESTFTLTTDLESPRTRTLTSSNPPHVFNKNDENNKSTNNESSANNNTNNPASPVGSTVDHDFHELHVDTNRSGDSSNNGDNNNIGDNNNNDVGNKNNDSNSNNKAGSPTHIEINLAQHIIDQTQLVTNLNSPTGQ